MSLHLKVVALGAVLALASGHPSAQNPTMKTAMRDKLVNTQRLLEAVVTADYAAIGRSSAALSRISETEVASWQAVARPEYTEQASRLLLSVQGLREAAAGRNLQAVTEEYATLVSSCVRCHAFVQRSRIVSLEPFSPADAR